MIHPSGFEYWSVRCSHIAGSRSILVRRRVRALTLILLLGMWGWSTAQPVSADCGDWLVSHTKVQSVAAASQTNKIDSVVDRVIEANLVALPLSHGSPVIPCHGPTCRSRAVPPSHAATTGAIEYRIGSELPMLCSSASSDAIYRAASLSQQSHDRVHAGYPCDVLRPPRVM